MASAAVATKGVPMAALLKKVLAAPATSASAEPLAASARCPACVAGAGARRLYNTGGSPLRRYAAADDDDEEEESSDEDTADDRRRARAFAFPTFFSSDLADTFGAPTTLAKLLALVDDAAPASRKAGLSAAAATRGRGWWVAKEDDDAMQLKVPMPGLAKEHVKVWAEQNNLVIKGEGDAKEAEAEGDEAGPLKYSRRIELATDAFKMDQIKAEMKNGVLKVTVPKVKNEERKDVFHVQVE
ncbi:hypothetical protein ACP70R_041597 [Stipagrostis hirtigluma subsp. patula]